MAQARRARREEIVPTQMGERILSFMTANYVTDLAEFSEGLLGVPLETFLSWLYQEVSPEALPARPMLVCADALGTNPEYLMCLSDDPRPGHVLTYDESVLIQSFRDIPDDAARQKLLRSAVELAAESPEAPHTNSPYPKVRIPRKPPGAANEA